MSESTPAAGTAGAPTPVLSVGPVVLPAPDRAVDLEVRVSAPVTGSGLPVVLLSHGLGLSDHLSSLHGYAPLADFWAAHGFVVIQPTHLDSATLRTLVPATGAAGAPQHWRSRAEDMRRVLDRLDEIEAAVPGYDVAETTDENPERVAVVQRLTWAYLRSALHPGDPAWRTAREALAADPDPLGRIESKQAGQVRRAPAARPGSPGSRRPILDLDGGSAETYVPIRHVPNA